MSRGNSNKARRWVALGLAAAAVVSVASLALAFAGAKGTQQVAANARDLHLANATLGSSALARAANSQAIFFVVDRAAGMASDDAATRAIGEAHTAIEVFATVEKRLVETLRPGAPLSVAATKYLEALNRTVSLVEGNEIDRALLLHESEVETAFNNLDMILADRQAEIEARIGRTEGTAGRLAWATQALVTLLIPAAALNIYRAMTRRRVQDQRMMFETKLAAEKDLNTAKDQFIAGLSHEFRTPLTSIYGFSEVLLEHGLVDPESSIELIGLINSESAELSRMVEDLLTAARIEASALTYKPESVRVIDEIQAVTSPLIRQGRTFTIEVGEDTVWADPLRLRQVLRNLLSNAVKHGGPRIGIRTWIERGELVCLIADDGQGVPNEIAGKLFERFVHDGRQSLLTGSVGLGLNIARSLVLDMGGDLVYERIGHVTCFTLRLPIAPRNPEISVLSSVGAARES